MEKNNKNQSLIKTTYKYIPCCVTLSNLLFGVLAIFSAIDGSLNAAIIYVLLGSLCDSFDGFLARKLGVSSEFGKELDSLVDIVTFSVAPVVIFSQQHTLTLPGKIFIVMFVACAALRLARFNVKQSKSKYFIGLPVPAAAYLLLITSKFLDYKFAVVIGMFLAVAMISSIKIKNFKNYSKDEMVQKEECA